MRRSSLGRARDAARARSRAEWRDAVLERDDFLCRLRGVRGECIGRLHAHHVLPLSHGGKDELGNGLTVCRYHHLDVIHAFPAWSYEHGFLLKTPPMVWGQR